MELDHIRAEIDRIDIEIVQRLNARIRLASEVAKAKSKTGAPIYVPSREEQVFQKLAALNEGPLTESAIRSIYREIISAMIALERKLIIAYLGPEATYTQQAAIKNFGTSLTYHPMGTIPDVFTAVEKGEADYGVIPIENSMGGAVFHSLDMFIDSDLKIVSQVYLEIEHCLISHAKPETIKKVISKDQALIQCREWLARNLPHAQFLESDSTAKAVQRAGQEEGVAAIASALSSELYHVPIQARGIQDRVDNVTRFLVIGKGGSAITGDGMDKTSIVISVSDSVGALEKALQPFSARGINLTKIESRPSRMKAWDYVFFIDFIGHWDDPKVRETIADVKQSCVMVKWLGSYPKLQKPNLYESSQ